MAESIITDRVVAFKIIVALYKAGMINASTYHNILEKYAPTA